MKTTIQEKDGKLIAVFEGRLDTIGAEQTEREIQPLMDSKGKDIILDCTSLEYIASYGLRLFIEVLKNGRANGVHVYLKNVNEVVDEVFMMTGFSDAFERI